MANEVLRRGASPVANLQPTEVTLTAANVTLVVQNMTVNPAITLTPTIEVRSPEVVVNVPQVAAPSVVVQVPEAKAPTVVVNVPEQQAPVVTVTPTFTVNVPELAQPTITFAPTIEASPVHPVFSSPEVTPTFNVPQAAAPNVVVEVKPRGNRKVQFTRDKDGNPTSATITSD